MKLQYYQTITGTYDNVYGSGAGYLPTMSGYDLEPYEFTILSNTKHQTLNIIIKYIL